MLIATAATAMLPLATFGQARYATNGPGSVPSMQGPMQALYTAPAEGQSGRRARYIDGYGNPMIVPAGYYELEFRMLRRGRTV